MREIKFRALDKKEKSMCIGNVGVTRDGFCSLSPDKDRFILMQFTGLLDKNGKEIYEGDIVKYLYLNTIPAEERFAPVELMPIGDVNRNITAYYPFCYSISGSYKEEKREVTECYLTPPDACEVIGNIYENPELLSSNK